MTNKFCNKNETINKLASNFVKYRKLNKYSARDPIPHPLPPSWSFCSGHRGTFGGGGDTLMEITRFTEVILT